VPNPARDSAVVRFTPRAAGEVNFAIYDVLGRRIRTLYAGRIDAALQEFAWDGRDDGGRDVHSGVYLARIETTEGTRSARIVMLK